MNIKPLPQVDSVRQIACATQFQDKLYAGLCWPVDRQPLSTLSMLRFEPDADGYNEVTASELSAQGPADSTTFWQTGCNAMTVFSRKSDTSPVLCASMLTPSGCKLSMTGDGEKLEALPPIDDNVLVRSMAAFNGRLFAATYNAQRLPVVYCTADPVADKWERVSEPGFSDTGNISITSMAEFNGSLYVALLNPTSGFQLWRTTADGHAPYQWTQVISQGARRYTQNPAVTSMAEFNGALYIGTGLTGVAANDGENGFAAAELIQVFADDSWEIIAGSPRFSPAGLKVPMAAMGPGFDNRSNTSITAMAVNEGRLYAATRRTGQASNALSNNYGLWSTADGEEWSTVSTGEAETGEALTVRAIIAAADNLLLATSGSGHYDLFLDAAINSKRERSSKEPSLLRFAKKLFS